MKTLILTIFTSAIFLLNTQAQINYHITGKMDRNDVDKVYLYANKVYIDSSIVKAGTFEMKGNYRMPAIAFIRTTTPFSATKIILDNGEYTVLLDTKLFPINIESTAINYNLWQDFDKSKELQANQKSQDSLLTDYKLQIEKGNYNLSAPYYAKYRDIQLKLLNYFKKLATDHSDCYTIPYLLKNQAILTWENFGATFDHLSPEVRNNEWGQQLKISLEKKVAEKSDKSQLIYTMLGSKANYFDSKQIDGKNFNLASLKGKWILLDFWASWCAPCRAEVPTLNKAYKQFNNKNFVIASVSVDSDKTAWQNAIREDETQQFTHINLVNFGKSEASKLYQINSIPTNFLINPEGRIVGMDLRGEDLINTLTRLIK